VKVLVIPSVRENSIKEFLAVWKGKGGWDKIVLVEDNPGKTFEVEVDYHYSWKEIDLVLEKDKWIISRRDSAIRSFGFLIAYNLGCDYILTLDDDCYPLPDTKDFFGDHLKAMRFPKWVPSLPRDRSRGLPYENLGKKLTCANMGFWAGVPDLDSIQSLPLLEEHGGVPTNFEPPEDNRIVPNGQYFPLCGMNFCFNRFVAPLAYFPLMGIGSPFGRFDDIWFGIIFKKIIDHLNLQVSVGGPNIKHIRASNVWKNFQKEAPGIIENEIFWEKVESCKLTSDTPIDCMHEMGAHFQSIQHYTYPEFYHKLGKALQIWANLFKESP